MTNGLEKAKRAITEVCEALKTSDAIPRAIEAFRDFLLEKNKAYGNSIYEPVRVFTNASIDSLILVRLNDKATRLLKGESGGEDSFDDLLGYLILRKALPLYLTWDTKEGQEALDALHCGAFERIPIPVPGAVVTESLKNRGLRVGMTFQEVRGNKWTKCEGERDLHDDPPSCTEGDPCSACKFLDQALCECGHPYTVHHPAMASFASDCHACPRDVECPDFYLASWPTESLDDVAAEVAAHVNANVDGWTAEHAPQPSVVFLGASPAIEEVHGIPSRPDDVIVLPVSNPSEAPNLVDAGTPADYRAIHEKKPRINRATWHETDEGKDAILRVTGALTSEPVKSWYAREVANEIGVGASDVSIALEHLLTTGAVVKHGKAKGTRYALAGFTDWPAPLPRGKKPDDQFAEEEPSTIIGVRGAT